MTDLTFPIERDLKEQRSILIEKKKYQSNESNYNQTD